MIPAITFTILAAGLVFLAGRKDAARDPRLTVLLLVLSAAFPLMLGLLPKIEVLPAPEGMAVESGFPWRKILLAVWAVGFLFSMARLVFAAMVLRSWRNRSVSVDRLANVEIRELTDLRSPVAAGILRPVVFMPSNWRDWSEASRRVVLEHELAHHRRRDPLWRMLAEVACAVHWYHPLVRWMARRFILQCEYACDARVLREGIDAKIYANVLCDFAEERPISPLALAMAESSSLESRVVRMLKPSGAVGATLLLALGALGLAGAFSLSMIGRQAGNDARIPAEEVRLRLTADPFPGEP